MKSSSKPTRLEASLNWLPPMKGWYKLKSDDEWKRIFEELELGVRIRNSNGCWDSGFSVNLRVGSVFGAELWGLYIGLNLAWKKMISFLAVEMDSVLMVF